MPNMIFPQLAKSVRCAPASGQWLHEIKFDGYRLICFVHNKNIKLKTRRNQDWTTKFPHLVQAIRKLHLKNAILDGEVVALDKNQHSSFQLLQNAIQKQQDENFLYYVFDIIYYDQYDLSILPLIERKKILAQLITARDNQTIMFSDHIIGNGPAVFKKTCKLHLEGLVSKRIDSRYLQKRAGNWLKIKCAKRQEFVIAGFTKPKGKRGYFGALLLGYYGRNKKLQYCGRVGTGFTEESLKAIAEMLNKYKTSKSPFNEKLPASKDVIWVKPTLVAEIEFLEWTKEGVLRQPSFKGLRFDKNPRKVRKEE